MDRSKLLLPLLILPLWLDGRTWQDNEGRSFEGLLLMHDAEYARIERESDKRQFKIERSKLSAADNAYLDDLDRQERLDKLMKDIPRNFVDAMEKSAKEEVPAIVFYRNTMSLSEFNKLLDQFLTKPAFQEKIKDKAIVAVITERDTDFEGIFSHATIQFDHPCFVMTKDYRNYGRSVLKDMEMSAFLAQLDKLYSQYDKSIY